MDELRILLLGIGLILLVLIYLWGMRKQIRERLAERRRRAQARVPENEPQLVTDEETSGESGLDVWAEPEIRVIRPATVGSEPHPEPDRDPSATPSASAEALATPKTAEGLPADPPARQIPAAAKPDSVSETQPVPTRSDAASSVAAELPTRSRKPVGKSLSGDSEMTVLMSVMAAPNQQLRGGAIRVACEALELVLGDNGIWECRSRDTPPGMIFGIAHLKEPGTFDAEWMNSLETPGLLLFMQLPGPLDPVPAVDLMIALAGQLARRLGGTVCDERRNRMSTQAMIRLRARASEFERSLQAVSDG